MSTDLRKPMVPVDKLLAELGVYTIHDGRLEHRNNTLMAQYELLSKPLDVEKYRQRWYDDVRRRRQDKRLPPEKRQRGRPKKAEPPKDEDRILSPMGVILEIEKRTYHYDRLLREVSIPWGRAADTQWYAQAIRAWERLLAKAGFGMIDGAKNILMNKSTLTEWDIVKKLEGWLQVEVYTYAKMIMDVSWRDRDVSPSFSLTLNRPPSPAPGELPQGGGGAFITSMQRQSDVSKTYNFPETLKTEVERKTGQG